MDDGTMTTRLALVIFALTLIAGCPTKQDIGLGIDAGSEPELDSGSDAPIDDASTDAGSDAGMILTDAQILADARIDGGAPDAAIECGDVMTSSANCGRCGHDCGGAACVSGRCQPVQIASFVSAVRDIAIDDHNVYVIVDEHRIYPSEIVSVPQAGGTSARLAMDSFPSSWGSRIATDGTRVHWLTRGDYLLRSVPVAGGTPTDIDLGVGLPMALATDGISVFFTNDYGLVQSVPVSGGVPTTLYDAPNETGDVVVAGDELYFSQKVALGGCGELYRVPTLGGTASRVAPESDAAGCVAELTVGDGYLYWVGLYEELHRMPLPDGPVETLSPGFEDDEHLASAAHTIAADATHVYFATTRGAMGGGVLRRLSLTDGTREIMATVPADSGSLAISDRFVFFTARFEGLLYRIAK